MSEDKRNATVSNSTASKAANGITRRSVLRNASRGFALTAAVGIAPSFLQVPRAFAQSGLAAGMIGGPAGFPGAEAYQYGPDEPEGRAIEAVKQIVGAGKAPKSLKLGMSEGAIGQLTKPFPEGAPSIKDVWEKETGITLDIIGIPEGQGFTKTIQDIQTRSGTYDIYTLDYNRLGDLAETGGIMPLNEYVEKHKPEWDDVETGYVGGEQGVSLLNKYRGDYYGVSLDGDYLTWIYRTDLFGDEANKKAFQEQFGTELKTPDTFEELDRVAQFFHRPDDGLFGCTDLRNQGWGYVNWYQRYATTGKPNRYLFSDEGEILVNSPEGVKATTEYVDSLSYHSPDAVAWSWPEQYGNMASGGAAMTCAFTNMPKFLDTPANEASKVVGKLGSFMPVGRIHGDDMVRRGVLWFNTNATVSKQAENPEIAYLFLQWLGSAKVSSWMTANPAGYFDPWRVANLNDPLVARTYHDYHVETIKETIRRAVPSINYPGATAFHNALDENLVAACTKTKTPEQAMADVERQWKRVMRRIGEDKIREAIAFNNSAWPTVLDPIPA